MSFLSFFSKNSKPSPPQLPAYGQITKPLANRKGKRRLHPDLRSYLESEVFKAGAPAPFLARDWKGAVTFTAEALARLHIRTRQNSGKWVNLILKTVDLPSGYNWCMATNQTILAFLEDYFQVESPVAATGSCLSLLHDSQKWLKKSPEPGLMTIWQHGQTIQGHTGTAVSDLSADGTFVNIEGNTSGDANDPAGHPDGIGIYTRIRPLSQVKDMVLKGFVPYFPEGI